MITNKQIQKVKTLQRVCALDDDAYRDILRIKGGVNSCTELSSKKQIDSVIGHLENLAEKVDKQSVKKATNWKWENSPEGLYLIDKAKKIVVRPNRPSLQQFQYIWGLWWMLRGEWKNNPDSKMETTLNHFLENGRGGDKIKVANWQWLTDDKAHELINVLKGRVFKKKEKTTRKK